MYLFDGFSLPLLDNLLVSRLELDEGIGPAAVVILFVQGGQPSCGTDAHGKLLAWLDDFLLGLLFLRFGFRWGFDHFRGRRW